MHVCHKIKEAKDKVTNIPNNWLMENLSLLIKCLIQILTNNLILVHLRLKTHKTKSKNRKAKHPMDPHNKSNKSRVHKRLLNTVGRRGKRTYPTSNSWKKQISSFINLQSPWMDKCFEFKSALNVIYTFMTTIINALLTCALTVWLWWDHALVQHSSETAQTASLS